jgi:hypothetical protein
MYLILIKNHYDDISSMYWYFEVYDGIVFILKYKLLLLKKEGNVSSF